jgi:hypothetical protein
VDGGRLDLAMLLSLFELLPVQLICPWWHAIARKFGGARLAITAKNLADARQQGPGNAMGHIHWLRVVGPKAVRESTGPTCGNIPITTVELYRFRKSYRN